MAGRALLWFKIQNCSFYTVSDYHIQRSHAIGGIYCITTENKVIFNHTKEASLLHLILRIRRTFLRAVEEKQSSRSILLAGSEFKIFCQARAWQSCFRWRHHSLASHKSPQIGSTLRRLLVCMTDSVFWMQTIVAPSPHKSLPGRSIE